VAVPRRWPHPSTSTAAQPLILTHPSSEPGVTPAQQSLRRLARQGRAAPNGPPRRAAPRSALGQQQASTDLSEGSHAALAVGGVGGWGWTVRPPPLRSSVPPRTVAAASAALRRK